MKAEDQLADCRTKAIPSSSIDAEAPALGLDISSRHLALSRNAERVAGHMRGRSYGREVRNGSVSSTVEWELFAPARTPDTTRASDTSSDRERRRSACRKPADVAERFRHFFQPVAFLLPHRASTFLHQIAKGTRLFET